MTRLIVSVVSHGHEQLIINYETLKLLASIDNVVVICRDNKGSDQLSDYCKANGIHYVGNPSKCGFAKNNNLNFIYYCEHFSFMKNDIFLLMNPDILLEKSSFDIFYSEALQRKNVILTANLFLDSDFKTQDHNVRRYPRLVDFFCSYLFDNNATLIDRSNNELPSNEKLWVSGAFLSISTEHYLTLQGLDESFYMYCEDIDFCKRALMLEIDTEICMASRIVHSRSRDSRSLFSSFFYWHFMGVLKLLTKQKSLLPTHSSLASYTPQHRELLNDMAR